MTLRSPASHVVLLLASTALSCGDVPASEPNPYLARASNSSNRARGGDGGKGEKGAAGSSDAAGTGGDGSDGRPSSASNDAGARGGAVGLGSAGSGGMMRVTRGDAGRSASGGGNSGAAHKAGTGAGGYGGAGLKAGAGGKGGRAATGAVSAYGTSACENCVRNPMRANSPCMKAKDQTLVDYCLSMPDKAKTGPRAGADRSELCADLLICVQRTSCDQRIVDTGTGAFIIAFSDCYCGAGALPDDCFIGTSEMATGSCKREVEAAAETTDISEISARMFDPEYASGVVLFILEACEALYCPLECGACKPGVSVCGLESHCSPAPSDGAIPPSVEPLNCSAGTARVPALGGAGG